MELSKQDLSFLELINLTRNNPVLMADMLGLDADVFADISEKSVFWDANKPALYFEPALQKAVAGHADELIRVGRLNSDNGWLASDMRQRALGSGYEPVRYSDYMSLAVITNFMKEEEAVVNLYRQFFLDQVDLFKDNKPSIFDYGLKGAGARLVSARLDVGGGARNVYIFAASFGRSYLNNVEAEIFTLINQFRKNPQLAFDFLNISREDALEYLAGQRIVLMMESSSLVMKPALSRISGLDDNFPAGREEGNSFHLYEWLLPRVPGVSAGETAKEILGNYFDSRPHDFFQMIFAQEFKGIDIVVQNSKGSDPGLEIKVGRFLIDPGTHLLWQGRFFVSDGCPGTDDALFNDLPPGTLLALTSPGGEHSLSGIDDSGLFMLELKFGSHRWEVLSEDEALLSGEFFARSRSQWSDIYICQ